MCYGENGTVKFLETLADNVFRHNYSMMQFLNKIELWENFGVTQAYTLKMQFFFQEKRVTKFGKSKARVAILDFESLQKGTTLLEDL